MESEEFYRSAHLVICILINRLGGEVVITDKELTYTDMDDLLSYRDYMNSTVILKTVKATAND